MIKGLNQFGNVLTTYLFCVLVLGCGGKKASETTVDPSGSAKEAPKPPSVDSKVFAPFEKAQTGLFVPLLLTTEGVNDTKCFRKVEGKSLRPVDVETSEEMDKHSAAVSRAVGQWILDEFKLDNLNKNIVDGWSIEAEDAGIVDISPADLAFEEGQECIDRGTGKLADDAKAVVKLVGATQFKFESTLPIGVALQEELLSVLKSKNMVMESPQMFKWEVAKDENGDLKKDEKGQFLYMSPSGVLVLASEVPPESERMIKNWTIKLESPVYFAYGEITDEYWRREGKKNLCDVYLVWGDVSLRRPDCEEFQESGFSAKKTSENELSIAIVTGQSKKDVVMTMNKDDMIQLDDRILLWLKPKKIEEGVLLQINSLVLNPAHVSAVPTLDKDKTSLDKPVSNDNQKKKNPKGSDQDIIDSFIGD